MVEVIIGGKTFNPEDRLIKKLDLLCDRVTKEHPKQDSTIGIDSKTGGGKTNASILYAGYVKQKTGRPINLFFTTESALRFAQSTEQQLIILDEPSLDLLARDWASGLSKDFLRLLNTMRRKRHFFIINFANFWLFPEHLVVDRLNGLVHMDPKQLGRGVWIRQNKLEKLWNDYKKLRQRNFNKYKSFRFWLPYIMEDGIFENLDITIEGKPHCTYEDYEELKDKSIQGINKDKKKNNAELKKLLDLRHRIAHANWSKYGITQEQLGQLLNFSTVRFREWRNIDMDRHDLVENLDKNDQNP